MYSFLDLLLAVQMCRKLLKNHVREYVRFQKRHFKSLKTKTMPNYLLIYNSMRLHPMVTTAVLYLSPVKSFSIEIPMHLFEMGNSFQSGTEGQSDEKRRKILAFAKYWQEKLAKIVDY